MHPSSGAANAARSPPDPTRRQQTTAATHVIDGSVPDPLISSRGRAWRGITVELHQFDGLDALVQSADHVIAVHLAGNVALHRKRCGRVRCRAMSAGDVTITPVGPPVRWRQAGQSAVILLRLSPEYVRDVAGDECAVDPDQLDIQEQFATRDPRIDSLARRLLAAVQLDRAHGALQVDMLKRQLATHLIVTYRNGACVAVPPRMQLSPHKLKRTVEFIEENLCSKVTLAAIANVVALSPGHFAHAFRQSVGVTPHRYVLERRVERAKLLLVRSDLSLTEIAERVGCCSQSHFSVMFHRATGLCPRQFRNRG